MNATNADQFKKWSEVYPNVSLVCDGSTCNEERLGAVGCIGLSVEHFSIQDDLVVIGGYVMCVGVYYFNRYTHVHVRAV